ncbi:hypothetical protein OG876_00435 [Kribbella sp. NBC_00359]
MTRIILLASPRSFCAGVERAVDIVERLLATRSGRVYVRHSGDGAVEDLGDRECPVRSSAE